MYGQRKSRTYFKIQKKLTLVLLDYVKLGLSLEHGQPGSGVLADFVGLVVLLDVPPAVKPVEFAPVLLVSKGGEGGRH